jgi:hypothetical protein
MFGESDGIEVISAQYGPPDLVKKDVNLYLIGSGKVNPTTKAMLPAIQPQRKPMWSFAPYPPGEPETGDWRVALYKNQRGKLSPKIGKQKEWGEIKELLHSSDYGIIIRGPHPFVPGRMVLILAGAHSLGTGAACLAATRSSLIRQLKNSLPEKVELADMSRTIWALVQGESSSDRLLDESGVKVIEAGCWD